MREQDGTSRFTARAADYARYRPTYPPEIIAEILSGFSAPSVADLGAGTGISSVLLANAGARVYAVEPNEAMRAAVPAHERISPISGTAEETTLPNTSVDVVTAFQAYHWFDHARVLAEAERITKPRARFAGVWNHRDRGDAFTGAYEAIVDKYDTSGGTVDRERRFSTIEHDLRAASWTGFRKIVASHVMDVSWEALIGFARSTSYTPREGPAYEAMAHEMRQLFDREARNGMIRFSWITEAYIAERYSATMV